MSENPTPLGELIASVGESVSIFWDPRNEGMEWTVGLSRVPMLHEHFPTLREGLVWLRDNRPNFEKWEQQISGSKAMNRGKLFTFTEDQEHELRGMLSSTLTPQGIEYWLSEVQRTGASFQEAKTRADALRSGAFT